MKESCYILIEASMKFVSDSLTDSESAMIFVMP